ncbi:hypothetical protein ABK040_003500 [Willaertia magna]
MTVEEERQTKKRKIESFIPLEIIYEISKYIDYIIDFLHLTQINKYYFENLLIKENEIVNEIFKSIFKAMNFRPKPTTTFPNYLFDKFQSLSLYKMDDFKKLKKFTNLKTLRTWKIPNDYIFDNLLKLEEIYIYDRELNNNSLSKLTHLKKLSLQDSKFKISVSGYDYLFLRPGVGSNFLPNLTNLEYLDIISEWINGEDFKNLTKLKHLKILHCNIDDVIENEAYLKNVKRLSLQYYEITDLKQFTNLVKLDISFTRDNDHFNSECFLHLINLEKLNMKRSDTKKIKDEHFINLKKLEHLNISYCKGITGECFKYLTHLKTLFAEKSEVKEEYLEHLQNIKKLYLTHCNQILKGEFLLNMNRLNELEVGHLILINRVEIEKIKKRIEKGELLKEIINKRK